MNRLSFPVLERGQTVGVVSPGFAVKRSALASGVDRLAAMGYRTRVGPHALARHGYLAGDDDARFADLDAMLRDPEVHAIWFSRGGYGVSRLLDRVSWRRLRRRPKLLIGYSDLTALFAAAVERVGPICLYGPVVSELGDARAYHAPSLRRVLAGKGFDLKFKRRQVLCEGRAQGPLIGGNLAMLTRLCGTRFAPRSPGAILFIEEIGEQTYRIDGMLTQLRQSGILDGLSGVLIGSMIVPARRRFPPDREIGDVLRESFLPLGVPVVEGLPAGHCPGKRTLPLGAPTEIDTRAGRVRFRG